MNQTERDRLLFIISSSEGLVYAESLKGLLDESLDPAYGLAARVWNSDDMFVGGLGTYERLEMLANMAFANGRSEAMGYAIAVMTPDDEVIHRGKVNYAPRDNVIMEFGIFMGKIGRRRVFAMTPEGAERLRLPSDLDGVSCARYRLETNARFRSAAVKDGLRGAVDKIVRWIDLLENPANPRIYGGSLRDAEMRAEVIPAFEKSY